MVEATVRVEGLTELLAGFRKADAGLAREVQAGLRDVGNVVRLDAQGRATRNIRNIGQQWPLMRLGSTMSSVYIVPKQRRRGGTSRPNLGILLLERAMIPAAEENKTVVEKALEATLDDLNANAGLISKLHAMT